MNIKGRVEMVGVVAIDDDHEDDDDHDEEDDDEDKDQTNEMMRVMRP